MEQCTRNHRLKEAQCEAGPNVGALLGPDPLTEALRGKIREALVTLFDEELTQVLGAAKGERVVTRCGYRHGAKARELTTGLGKVQLALPRGRLFAPEGGEREWESHLLPRYQRRARAVDAAILGAYLTGANSRRIHRALSPLLRGAPLSKSAVSRIVGRLKALFEEWRQRSLADQDLRYLYLDAIALKVRVARKVVSVPVLVGLGVDRRGRKEVLDLELCASESTSAWEGFVAGLTTRGLRAPVLVILDGSPGLAQAVAATWPGAARQRCAVHKLRNLLRHAPKHAVEEVKADFHRIVYSAGAGEARTAYQRFLVKWRKLAPQVAASLLEAGEELLTFYRFPESQWKALRTTNAIERLHEEFRRRVKTQGALPDTQTAEVLLFGLLASGQIRMRRLDGWQDMDQIPVRRSSKAA
jgi:transposase-like protein